MKYQFKFLMFFFLIAFWLFVFNSSYLKAQTEDLVQLPSLAPVVEKAQPAVVNIFTVKLVKGNAVERNIINPFRGQPGGEIFDDFFEMPNQFQGRDHREKSLGSGFIFDPEGYIITNNHVVENADDIKVKLSDGSEIEAELIGRDPKTDLALIKLKKAGPYPFINLADSSKIKIGDWVLAIGNPFGLEHTVTSGILSAKSRSIGAGPYDDFLQTDASINFGNSGGPLLNLKGEVVGINTAIVARATNIGFAIPSNLAKNIISQLKSKGKVDRGWIGVVVQKITPDMVKGFGLKNDQGALVGDVLADGPALAAGLKRGDVILKFNGKDIKTFSDLPIIVADTEIGKSVPIVIIRDNKEMTLNIKVQELKDEQQETIKGEQANIGIKVRDITPEIARRLGVSADEGVVVDYVEPGSVAAELTLKPGDVIIEVGREAVKNVSDYSRLVNKYKPSGIILFSVKRDGNNIFIPLPVK